jgi:hypothetical protein
LYRIVPREVAALPPGKGASLFDPDKWPGFGPGKAYMWDKGRAAIQNLIFDLGRVQGDFRNKGNSML